MLTLPRNTLSALLAQVLPAADHTNAGRWVRLSTGDGFLRAVVDNLETRIEASVLADAYPPEDVAVDVKHLAGVVKLLPDAPVALAIAKEGTRLDIKSGPAHHLLVTTPAADLPDAAPFAPGGSITVSAPSFARLCRFCIPGADAQDERYGLKGLHLEHDETDGIRLVSTDGNRLHLAVQAYYGMPFALPSACGIPERFAHLLAKQTDGDLALSWSDDGKALRVDYPTLRITTRAVQEEFPTYRSTLPHSFAHVVSVTRAHLLDAARRVAIDATDRARTVRFAFGRDELVLSACAVDQGDATHPVPIANTGDPLTIGFNVRFILDALSVIEAENITWSLGEALSPSMMRADPPTGDFAVLMPLRLE